MEGLRLFISISLRNYPYLLDCTFSRDHAICFRHLIRNAGDLRKTHPSKINKQPRLSKTE